MDSHIIERAAVDLALNDESDFRFYRCHTFGVIRADSENKLRQIDGDKPYC